MVKRIVIATKNLDKLREIELAFDGLAVEIFSLADIGDFPDAVEDGDTFAENARIKAHFFRAQTGIACLADDSGLEVDALGGLPGVHSARFAGYHAHDFTNNSKLVAELTAAGVNASKACYRCALCFVDTTGSEIFANGALHGVVKNTPRGTGGFGYDPYFYLPSGETLAELSIEAKSAISHRGVALRDMIAKLKGRLSCSSG